MSTTEKRPGEIAKLRRWQEVSEADWEAFEASVKDGADFVAAARERNLSTSAFRKADFHRHAEVLEMWRDLRSEYVHDRLKENVERAMQAKPVLDHEGNETGEWTYQGAVANKSLELIGRSAGMFGERVQVDVEHTGAVIVEHKRGFTIGDLARFALELDRSGNGTVDELPAARELLPPSQ